MTKKEIKKQQKDKVLIEKISKMSKSEFDKMQNKLLKRSKFMAYFAFAFGSLAIISSIAIPFLNGIVAAVFMGSFFTSIIGMTISAAIGAKAEKKYGYNYENKDIVMGTWLDKDVAKHCIERTSETNKKHMQNINEKQEITENNQETNENDLSL